MVTVPMMFTTDPGGIVKEPTISPITDHVPFEHVAFNGPLDAVGGPPTQEQSAPNFPFGHEAHSAVKQSPNSLQVLLENVAHCVLLPQGVPKGLAWLTEQ